MGRLVWTEAESGWRSGRYRIELVAAGMWALSVESYRGVRRPVAPRIATTSASLRGLKRRAELLEWRRQRHRTIGRYAMATAAAVSGFALMADLPPAWMVLTTIALVLFCFRSVAAVADALTNSSWARLRQTYQ